MVLFLVFVKTTFGNYLPAAAAIWCFPRNSRSECPVNFYPHCWRQWFYSWQNWNHWSPALKCKLVIAHPAWLPGKAGVPEGPRQCLQARRHRVPLHTAPGAADGGGLFKWQSWAFLRRHTALATEENNQWGGLRRAVLEHMWETNARLSRGSGAFVVPGMAVCWIHRVFLSRTKFKWNTWRVNTSNYILKIQEIAKSLGPAVSGTARVSGMK